MPRPSPSTHTSKGFTRAKPLRPPLPDGPVTVPQAARLLGVSRRQMAKLLDGHQVLTIRVRGKRLVPVNELAGQLLQAARPSRLLVSMLATEARSAPTVRRRAVRQHDGVSPAAGR